MIYRVRIFNIAVKTDTTEINEWLKANKDIKIISTNTFANDTGWGYAILYTGKIKNDME
jgi:hypothetical protein